MVPITKTGKALWEKLEASVEKVQRRLRRAVDILARAGVPYAVVGGNAVRVWVAQVDEAAVRATQDVDILISRENLEKVIAAMGAEGMIFRESAGLSRFWNFLKTRQRTPFTWFSQGNESRRTTLR